MKTLPKILTCLAILLTLPVAAPAEDTSRESEEGTASACPHPPDSLIVLRHACKATRCPDSLLNDLGHDQARHLVEDLAGYEIDAIFVTVAERTQETARPLAESIGQSIECREADPSKRCVGDTPEAIDDLLAEVCSGRYVGQVVLHVGHSHTLPTLFRRLGLEDPRSYLSAKPWEIVFGEDGVPTYEEVELEHTVPQGSKGCGTEACTEG